MEDPFYLPAHEIATHVRNGDLSPVAVIDRFLERIQQRNDRTNAYVTVIAEAARERAAAIERRQNEGDELGALAGVPVALKDLAGFKSGVRQTFGSVPFRTNSTDRTAVFVERLENADAIVLGMTNTPEFGHKGATDNRLFGATSTPFDTDRNAGGSSGGSAAALAAGLTTLAHGSDSGGSLRIPASFSGIYSIKPTYRRVAVADRPDGFGGARGFFTHHGPMTRTVADAGLMLEVMAGPHPRDPTSLPDDGTEYRPATERSVEDLSAAYTPDFGTFPVDATVRKNVERALEGFEAAGMSVTTVDMDLPHTHREITDAWLTLLQADYASLAASLQELWDVDLLGEHRHELTPQFARLIQDGLEVELQEYFRLNHLRTELFDAIQDIFEEFDVILSPTVGCLPFENSATDSTVGPSKIDGVDIDPLIGWSLTHPFNLTGHPAASLPGAFTETGLPVGVQVVGPRFSEERLLAVSAEFERVRPWAPEYQFR